MGEKMNVNLGAPVEASIQRLIKRGYAGNQTELLRQAVTAYERQIDDEEHELVQKAVEMEMQEIKAGKVKTYSWDEVKKKAGL